MNMILVLLRFSIPHILHWLKIKTLTSNVNNFFCNSMQNVLDYRRSTGFQRNDFVQLLLQLKDKGLVELDCKETVDNFGPNEINTEKFGMFHLFLFYYTTIKIILL